MCPLTLSLYSLAHLGKETPKNHSWSHLKNEKTAKFLGSSTPGGLAGRLGDCLHYLALYLCMAFTAIHSLVLVYLSNHCCTRQSEFTCSPCLLPPYLFMVPYCPQLLSDHFSFPVSPFISPFLVLGGFVWIYLFFSFVCDTLVCATHTCRVRGQLGVSPFHPSCEL